MGWHRGWWLVVCCSLAVACGDDDGGMTDDGGTADGGVDAGADAGSDAGSDGGGGDAGDPCESAACDENATCSSTSGVAICQCNDGFVGDGETCEPETFCTEGVCGVGTCNEEDDGYSCTCPSGYADDGTTCADVDECTAGTDDCDPAATCMNTPGAFACSCPTGFGGDGRTCTDLNECAAETDTCTASQLCFNTPGSFSCACRPGTRTAACTPMRVLVYDDDATDSQARDAAESLGYTVQQTTSRAAFQTAFDAGGFDLVIYDAPGFGLDSGDEGRLRSWITSGGQLIFSAYNLQSFPSMQSVLGVSVTSYNSPRAVHRASTAIVDLYAQFAAVPNPIPTARDAGDNGDQLTLTGGGLVLANLDSATGPGAIVLTNAGRVLVNGFLPYDMDTPAMTEMYRNQINLLMNPVVLDYHDSSVDAAPMAARRMAWTAVSTTSGAAFAAAYDAGLRDLIVVDVAGLGIPAEVSARLTSGIPAGDRVVFSWWSLNTDPSLQTLLQVGTVSFSAPRPVFPSPGAPVDFFSLAQIVPVPLTTRRDAGDNGDELTPTAADGFVAGRFTSTAGPGAIAVTRSERVIVNGFLSFDVFDANDDADLLRDMEELYENQFLFLFAP